MKSIESTAKSIDLAIENGLSQLGISREQADIEILSSGGVFTKAKVRITVKDTAGARAKEFLVKLLEKMSMSGEVILAEDGEKVRLNIAGEGMGAVIGYRGEVLDSLQYLTSIVANREADNDKNDPAFRRVVIDSENYREKREVTLVELSERMADKAVRTGRKVALEPMNPYERRIIHAALSENAEVTTHSEGDEPNRYLVIVPKNLKDNREIHGGRTPGGRSGYGAGRGGFQSRDNNRGGYERKTGFDSRKPGADSPFLSNSGFSEQNTFFKKKTEM